MNLPPSKPRPLDPTKTLILRELQKNGERTVEQIFDVLGGVSKKAIGTALRQLWDRKLVTQSFRVGSNKSFWRLRDERGKGS
jgi:DNA-binding transcriptional ArsR family regulator